MKIAVSAPAGLEGVTKRELYKLLGVDATALNGRLVFDGDIETVAKCNLFLRTASRVFIVLGGFKAQTFDELFDGVTNIPFEDYIDLNGKIEVYGSAIESKLMAVSACSSIIKKAICKRLSNGKDLLENGERYKIEYVIRRDYVTISLDTSGEGLHKRGYRKELIGDAPLKENVASALVQLSVWRENRVLVDLFCGSGTIPIEAGMIAKNIAPGKFRDFDFLHYKKFDTSFYEEMKQTAIANEKPCEDVKIYGFDIDEKQVNISRKHAKQAGVGDIIHFQRADMRDFSTKARYGVIISNPPYGERLLTRKEIVSLYRDLGEKFKSLNDFSMYVLTSVTDFEKLVKKPADKKRKIYNGKLECTYYTMLGAKPQKDENL